LRDINLEGRTEDLWGQSHRHNHSVPSIVRLEGNLSLLDFSEVCK
jgi:hypothetical protein